MSLDTFIPELESLRGIAVLLVFTFHVNGFVLYPFPSASDTVSLPMAFVRAGHTGVDLFFLLSAFLLSRPFLDDGLGGKPVRLRDYFARRALRILPLYWTAVLVGTLLSASHPADALRAVPHLLFISGIPALSAPLAPYGAVWWSLETEVQFYLLLPLLAVFLRTPARRWAGLALLGLYTGAYVIAIRGAVTHWSLQAQLALWNSVFGRGPLFLCGIAAAAVYRRFGSAWRTALASVAAVRSGGADGTGRDAALARTAAPVDGGDRLRALRRRQSMVARCRRRCLGGRAAAPPGGTAAARADPVQSVALATWRGVLLRLHPPRAVHAVPHPGVRGTARVDSVGLDAGEHADCRASGNVQRHLSLHRATVPGSQGPLRHLSATVSKKERTAGGITAARR